MLLQSKNKVELIKLLALLLIECYTLNNLILRGFYD